MISSTCRLKINIPKIHQDPFFSETSAELCMFLIFFLIRCRLVFLKGSSVINLCVFLISGIFQQQKTGFPFSPIAFVRCAPWVVPYRRSAHSSMRGEPNALGAVPGIPP